MDLYLLNGYYGFAFDFAHDFFKFGFQGLRNFRLQVVDVLILNDCSEKLGFLCGGKAGDVNFIRWGANSNVEILLVPFAWSYVPNVIKLSAAPASRAQPADFVTA